MNSTMYRSGFDTSKVGKQTITAEHRGKSFEIEIEIEKKAVEVNKEILKRVVARAEKVKLKDYVNAGQEEFVKALDDARLILQKENATQQEVDEAIENLKLKTPDTDGSDNTGSKPNNNKEDGNQNNSKAESQAVKTGDQGNVLMQAILVLFAALSAVLLVKKRYNK